MIQQCAQSITSRESEGSVRVSCNQLLCRINARMAPAPRAAGCSLLHLALSRPDVNRRACLRRKHEARRSTVTKGVGGVREWTRQALHSNIEGSSRGVGTTAAFRRSKLVEVKRDLARGHHSTLVPDGRRAAAAGRVQWFRFGPGSRRSVGVCGVPNRGRHLERTQRRSGAC